MTARFYAMRITDLRHIDAPEQLTPLELEQLRIAGRMYDGEDRAPELRFVDMSESGDEDEGCLTTTGFLAVAKVFDGDRHVYDLVRIDPDAATLFVAGTCDAVAGRCQSTWMTPDLTAPFEHREALDAAMKQAEIW